MELAYKEAVDAFNKDEVPVGAVVVLNDVILTKASNLKESLGIATKHAEIIAVEKACEIAGDWRLDGATLYVTMEPCMMCLGAAIEARIKRIVYGCPRVINPVSKQIYEDNNIMVVENVLQEKCEKIVKDFFALKRNK